jgi:hypothetical protein
MTSKSKERKLFNAYKKVLYEELGHADTESEQLDKIGRREFGTHWSGVHPQDRVKLRPNSYCIVNTDTHDKPGLHWMAVYTTKNHAYIYDSYARPVKTLVRHLIDNINEHGFILGKTDKVHHMEQIGYSSGVCGQNSMAFLLVVRDLGIRKGSNI